MFDFHSNSPKVKIKKRKGSLCQACPYRVLYKQLIEDKTKNALRCGVWGNVFRLPENQNKTTLRLLHWGGIDTDRHFVWSYCLNKRCGRQVLHRLLAQFLSVAGG